MSSQHQNYIANSNLENQSSDTPIVASLPESKLAKAVLTDDDLIASLQNRRENRRARQVVEWEITRRAEAPYNVLRGAA